MRTCRLQSNEVYCRQKWKIQKQRRQLHRLCLGDPWSWQVTTRCSVKVSSLPRSPYHYLSKHHMHRVGRVLSLFSSRRNWDSPNPSPQARVPPPPCFWGEGNTRVREGLGGSQFRRGDKHSLYIRTLWSHVWNFIVLRLGSQYKQS